jgi:hypothetical protein
MATDAEGNEVLVRVAPAMTAKLFVVNFEVRHRTAELTTPIVTTQDLLA